MKKLNRGYLITFEGIDGSGKSTLARLVFAQLQKDTFPAILTKEPGGSDLGQLIRSILHDQPIKITPKAEYLLFAADRAQHFNKVIMPALNEHKIILSDRGPDSSVAYQGYGRGQDIEKIKEVNAWATDGIKPDLILYVSIDPQTGLARCTARGAKLTNFEKEKIDFFERIAAGFDALFKDLPNVIKLDGTQSPEQLAKQALSEILTFIS